MIKPILFSLFVAFFPLVKPAKFPPFLLKCNRKQADFDACVLKAAKNGMGQLEKVIKHLNLTPVNPFLVPEIRFDAQGNVAIEQKYRDVEVYGLTSIELENFRFDFEEKTIEISGSFPKLILLSNYEFSGKVLLLAVEGSGRGNVTIDNLQAKVLAKFEDMKKNNKTYIRVVSSKLKIIPKLLHFDFEHIFRENEEISKNINQVMNDNWREVFADVEEGYTEVVNTLFLSLLNQFFSKVSYEEAFQ